MTRWEEKWVVWQHSRGSWSTIIVFLQPCHFAGFELTLPGYSFTTSSLDEAHAFETLEAACAAALAYGGRPSHPGDVPFIPQVMSRWFGDVR